MKATASAMSPASSRSVGAACRQGDRGPSLREEAGRGLADTAARSGDQRNRFVQSFFHVGVLPRERTGLPQQLHRHSPASAQRRLRGLAQTR
jgi:hypothetical protein